MDYMTIYAILVVCLKISWKVFVGQQEEQESFRLLHFQSFHHCLVFHTLYSKALIPNVTSLSQAWVGTLTLYSSSCEPGILRTLRKAPACSGSWSEASKCSSKQWTLQTCSQWPSTFSKSIVLNAASIRPRKTTRRQNICDEREHQKKDFSPHKKQWSIKETGGQVKKQRAVNMKLKVSHNNLWGRKEIFVRKKNS